MSSIDKVNVGGTLYDIKDSKVIDDTTTSITNTWSSSKIDDELNGTAQAIISLSLGGTTTQATVTRYGKMCRMMIDIGNINITSTTEYSYILGTLPEQFRPPDAENFAVFGLSGSYDSNPTMYPIRLGVRASGEIVILSSSSNLRNTKVLQWIIQWHI